MAEKYQTVAKSTTKFEVLGRGEQLWVADITYVRLKAEFVYLAVILDGFSRKVVGWSLDRTLGMRLTVGALEQAIECRQPKQLFF